MSIRDSTEQSLAFRPIDLDRHAKLCVAFRRDSYLCSFGTDDLFVEQCGHDGAEYFAWLRERIALLPEGCIHVWAGDTIIGQAEMRVCEDPEVGYIHLFYLVPTARGGHAVGQLHDYAVRLFRSLSVRTIRLSVSRTNRRAIAYYRKHGWQDLGPRPDREAIHSMELTLDPSAS